MKLLRMGIRERTCAAVVCSLLIAAPLPLMSAIPEYYQIITDHRYKDVVLSSYDVWCLTEDGDIEIYNIATNTLREGPRNDFKVLILAKDAQDHIVIGDSNGNIKRFDINRQTWIVESEYEGNLLGILFDVSNRCFLITPSGILDPASKATFFPERMLNRQLKNDKRWSSVTCHLMDDRGNIWIGFGGGEYGGDLVVFNTERQEFVTPNFNEVDIASAPIQSILQVDTLVYITTGISHLSVSGGSLIRFNGFNAEMVLTTLPWKKSRSIDSTASIKLGDHLGPSVFSKEDDCIYMVSQQGVLKGDIRSDLTVIKNWKKYLDVQLEPRIGPVNRIQRSMNTKKLLVRSHAFIFFTSTLGVVIYNPPYLRVLGSCLSTTP